MDEFAARDTRVNLVRFAGLGKVEFVSEFEVKWHIGRGGSPPEIVSRPSTQFERWWGGDALGRELILDVCISDRGIDNVEGGGRNVAERFIYPGLVALCLGERRVKPIRIDPVSHQFSNVRRETSPVSDNFTSRCPDHLLKLIWVRGQ